MTGWRCEGRWFSAEEIAALGQRDGEALCTYAGVAFRFTAETVVPHTAGHPLPGESTTVMTLRRLDAGGGGPAVCLVDFSGPARFTAAERDWRLDEAAGRATGVARRHVAGELFRRAEEGVARYEVA